MSRYKLLRYNCTVAYNCFDVRKGEPKAEKRKNLLPLGQLPVHWMNGGRASSAYSFVSRLGLPTAANRVHRNETELRKNRGI